MAFLQREAEKILSLHLEFKGASMNGCLCCLPESKLLQPSSLLSLHVEFFHEVIWYPVLSESQSSKVHLGHKEYTLSLNLIHLL